MPQLSRATPREAGLRERARETFGDDAWYESPNAHLEGRSPREAVEAGDEGQVRAIIETVVHVGLS